MANLTLLPNSDDPGGIISAEIWSHLRSIAYFTALSKLNSRTVAREQEAEDIAMEGLENLFSALDREIIVISGYDLNQKDFFIKSEVGQRSLKAYLLKSIENLLKDRYNREKTKYDNGFRLRTEADFEDNAQNEEDDSFLDTLSDPDPYKLGTEAAALANLEIERSRRLITGLEHVISTLAPREKSIATTYYSFLLDEDNQDFNSYGVHKKTAEKLGIAANLVGVTMNRVRKKLVAWLEQEYQDEDLPRVWQKLYEDIRSKFNKNSESVSFDHGKKVKGEK